MRIRMRRCARGAAVGARGHAQVQGFVPQVVAYAYAGAGFFSSWGFLGPCWANWWSAWAARVGAYACAAARLLPSSGRTHMRACLPLSILGLPGVMLAHLEAILAQVGAWAGLLGAMLGPCSDHLAAIWEPSEAMLGSTGGLGGPSGGHLRAMMTTATTSATATETTTATATLHPGE